MSGSNLQCRFPIDDLLSHSGDIRDQVAKWSEIARKNSMFWAVNFLGEGRPKFLT